MDFLVLFTCSRLEVSVSGKILADNAFGQWRPVMELLIVSLETCCRSAEDGV